jgi:nitroreductase
VASGEGWPAGRGLLVGLSSIAWREAWKYGERAFRYCNHDVGHAIAALSLAAAALGWRVRLLDHLSGPLVGRLLGCDLRAGGPEGDHPDALLQMGPSDEIEGIPTNAEIEAFATRLEHSGAPAPLSPTHHDWPIIDEIRASTVWTGQAWTTAAGPPGAPAPADPTPFLPLVRGRRSAVAMDGQTSLPAAEFFQICQRLSSFHSPLPWAPQVALAIFVHRVTGLEPGLYLLPRHPDQEAELREALRPEAAWARPEGCPAELRLWQLGGGDLRQHARELCCHQDIAADGAFAVAMLARFAAPLAAHGPGFYPRLYWETGLVGQMLYLAAEAAGVQGTGIGCFFDDETHRLLDIGNQDWQSLYHFTVGHGVKDGRLRTTSAYPRGG